MSPGRQRLKKGGRRTSSKGSVQPRLQFLCDKQLPLRLCQEVGKLTGYRTRHIRDIGSTSVKDPGIIDEAIRHKTLILTFDADFLDPVDGLENVSTEFTYESIAERIQRLTATERWTFSYLGSNQDLSVVPKHLSIPIANMTSYTPTGEGTSDAWKRHSRATSRRMDEVSQGTPTLGRFYADEQNQGE